MTMLPSACAHEAAVERAARGGTPDAAVHAHLASCAACRETFEIVGVMMRFGADTEDLAANRDMPDASRIWWRARLLQRWEAETRATAPLDIMQRVEVIGGLVAAVVLLITMWPEMRGGLFGGAASQMTATTAPVASWWPTIAQVLAVPTGLTTLVVGGALLLGLMAVFTVHQLLLED
jgi:predicted anti-sigma-YlaC factor YlaD